MPLKVTASRSAKPEVKPLVIGVSFNQALITAALVDNQARIVANRQIETPQRTTRAAIEALADLILDLVADKERQTSPIAAIGLAVAGSVDPQTSRISMSGGNVFRTWTRVPLAQTLEELLDESGHDIRTVSTEKRARAHHVSSGHPPITVCSEMAAAAAAESWHGAARGKTNVVFLSIDTEIEAGILVNGRVLTGATGVAGAVGWLAVGREFKHEYEANGCLSAEASIASLTRRAVEENTGYDGSLLGGLIQSGADFDTITILRAARGGDKLAVKVVGDTCRWLGRGVANLISTLNPEAVVIGGEFGGMLKPFLDDVREEARRWAAPEAARQCRIVAASIGESSGIIGAARLASLKAGM